MPPLNKNSLLFVGNHSQNVNDNKLVEETVNRSRTTSNSTQNGNSHQGISFSLSSQQLEGSMNVDLNNSNENQNSDNPTVNRTDQDNNDKESAFAVHGRCDDDSTLKPVQQPNNKPFSPTSVFPRPNSFTSLNNNSPCKKTSTSSLSCQNRSWLSKKLSWLWWPFQNNSSNSRIEEKRAVRIMTPQTSRLQPRHCHSSQWSETTLSAWNMTRMWVFGMMTPIGIFAWMVTHQVSAVLVSVLVLPGAAILQGSLAILKYRVQFGDSPLPKAPSHGIVKCVSRSNEPNVSRNDALRKDSNSLVSEEASGYGTADMNHATSVLGEGVVTFQGYVDPEHRPTTAVSSPTTHSATPLCLLVIGDSLAVGVGQSETATPLMPETIAKALSKAMNGRPVLWTCHGAPGASAGWIVRELERSIQQGQFLQAHPRYRKPYPGSNNFGSSNNSDGKDNSVVDPNTSFADGDSCSFSSEESPSLNNVDEFGTVTVEHQLSDEIEEDHAEELKTWSDRLQEHKIRFDPNVLGPFDIAIVLTGSNDLKSAFFPFLLTGEDAEFRRQAQERGGSYGNELTRILQVLNRRMRMRLQTLRESVEATVDSIRERLNSHDMTSNQLGGGGCVRSSSSTTRSQRSQISATQTTKATKSSNPMGVRNQNPSLLGGTEDKESTNLLEADEMLEGMFLSQSGNWTNSSQFPMVVLPGMPARALPIFQTAPLRWLAVPIVDIMDSHKKKLARQHDGEVLFVDAPSCEDIASYACQRGMHWEEALDDKVLLNLRGIKRKQARRIESDMKAYFSKKPQSPTLDSLSLRRKHHSMFSVDGIHPNDKGYDFWGRYIAHAIVEEWKRKQSEQDSTLEIV